MNHKEWHFNRLRDFTLEDAMEAMNDGFYCICGDGNLSVLSNDPDVV